MHHERINTLLDQRRSENSRDHDVGCRGRQAHARDQADNGHEPGNKPDLPLPDRQHRCCYRDAKPGEVDHGDKHLCPDQKDPDNDNTFSARFQRTNDDADDGTGILTTRDPRDKDGRQHGNHAVTGRQLDGIAVKDAKSKPQQGGDNRGEPRKGHGTAPVG